VDVPEGTGIELPCYACDGRDTACPVCRGGGSWELRRCPGAVTEAWAGQTVELAVIALEGLGWPADGGVLEQSEQFLGALRLVAAERERIEKQRREAAARK
jgi:hypothetical protein